MDKSKSTPHSRDFPAEALKGSVALLRSKFGDSKKTDTSQIFGASSPDVTRRVPSQLPSNRFHNKYNCATLSDCTSHLRFNSKLQKFAGCASGSEGHSEVIEKGTNRCINNNNISIPAISKKSNTTVAQVGNRAKTSQGHVEVTIPLVSQEKLVESTPVTLVLDLPGPQINPEPEKKHQQEVPTTVNQEKSVSVEMANQALVDKYSHITDIDELNQKLKETRDFEERRALRAVIRKLRDASNSTPSRNDKLSAANTQEENGSKLDLTEYTSEEDLKVLLHQTSDYEDKRTIRAAIRELRKITGKPAAVESSSRQRKVKEKSEELSTPTSPSTAELSPSNSHANEVFSPPATPDAMAVLRNAEVGTPSSEIEVKDEELVSPVQHESRTLERPEGEIQIEKVSKHSRTTSHSDVYEKSMKITTTSKVGDLSISEQDEIITKEKLTQKGSVTTESDLIRKVNIRDKDGRQHIEEEICIEKMSHSKTKGEEKESCVQVSIIRDKQLPKILKELSDASGVDGEPLILTCEFENSAEELEVSWWKDGEQIKAGKDIMMTWDSPVATLNIQVLLYPDDTGSYVCRGKNVHGTVESSVHVEVTEVKMSFAEELTDKQVKDGDADVTLSCKLTEAATGAKVTWYKNRKVLRDNSEFRQAFDGKMATLIITEVFPEDSGDYECVIAHASQELSTLAKVHVADKAETRPASDDKTTTKKEDSNNNLCDVEDTNTVQEETITDEPSSNVDELTNGVETGKLTNGEDATDKSTNKERSLSKCEKILQSAAITDDTSNELKHADGKPALSNGAEKTSSLSDRNNSKTPAFTKPALKSVSKPSAMSRPTTAAEDTADSLVGRLSKPGTSGNVSVSQSWKSNVGGSLKTSQTSANKSWGKAGPGSKLLGKPAGSGKSAMAAFKQMDTANNPNSASAPKPNSLNTIPAAKHAAKVIKKRAIGMVEIKHEMLTFCQANTSEYENVKIENFSTSWNNGVAFLALIHHFYPDSFDWAKVDERRRRENFQLAFDLAEKKADIAPLLDVEDMVRMKKPDWKCVFTYVQSFYRKLRDHENNKHTYMQQ